MLKKILLSGLVLAGVFAVGYVVLAADGSNYVDVNSCTQVGKDIRINRGGQNYTLTSSCRDAGHGYRDYQMTCVSNKQYKVEWTEGCTPVKPPTPKDTEAPKVIFGQLNSTYQINETMNVYVSATDNTKVTRLVLYRDGVKVKETNTASMSYAFSTNKVGVVNFYAYAYDAAGNVGYKSLSTTAVNNVDTIAPIVTLTTDKKSYVEGDTAYVTASATDNVKVTRIEIYNEVGSLLKTCNYTNYCVATDVIKFNAPANINWGITGFSARAYDEMGNIGYKGIDVEVNRKVVNNNFSINAPISLFNENGVSWIKIEGNAYADVGVSSVEIYLGTSDTKYSQPLVKKCNYSGNDKSVSCVLSFPRSLYHGGFYWARAIAKDGSTKDSDLTYYNY
jgi:hypothetical protein